MTVNWCAQIRAIQTHALTRAVRDGHATVMGPARQQTRARALTRALQATALMEARAWRWAGNQAPVAECLHNCLFFFISC